MTTLEKIKNLTWWNEISKLKDILIGLNAKLKNLEDAPPLDSRPYKVYTAILSQSGTSTPTATVLENTLGNITWSRNSAGNYEANSNSLFLSNKTSILISPARSSTFSAQGQFFMPTSYSNESYIYLTTYTLIETAGVLAKTFIDGVISTTTIEIRVYN